MAEPRIPTMVCRECGGDDGAPCGACDANGYIPRPPLTPAEIAALPDGARVMIEWACGTVTQMRIAVIEGVPHLRWWSKYPESAGREPICRVWLAEVADG